MWGKNADACRMLCGGAGVQEPQERQAFQIIDHDHMQGW